MNMTNFDDFLRGLLFDDYKEIYELANAAKEGVSGNYYEVTQDGDKVFIKCVYTKATLALVSNEAREAFRKKMENEYMEGMDQESYWGYMHAKEKSDEEDAKKGL